MQDYFHPQMTQQELLAMSSLALAHIGDAVFELLVRTKLCVEGGTTNGRLHQQTVALVQAPAQARFALRIRKAAKPPTAAQGTPLQSNLAAYTVGDAFPIPAVPSRDCHGPFWASQ